MEMPSADRARVELQRAVTRTHQLLLRSPLGPWLDLLPGPHYLVLETRGRRSGRLRRTPLSFTKDGDAYVVIASNGGAPKHPDWSLNLLAHPEAEVTVAGATTPVRAETATGSERGVVVWRLCGLPGPHTACDPRRASRARARGLARLSPARQCAST